MQTEGLLSPTPLRCGPTERRLRKTKGFCAALGGTKATESPSPPAPADTPTPPWRALEGGGTPGPARLQPPGKCLAGGLPRRLLPPPPESSRGRQGAFRRRYGHGRGGGARRSRGPGGGGASDVPGGGRGRPSTLTRAGVLQSRRRRLAARLRNAAHRGPSPGPLRQPPARPPPSPQPGLLIPLTAPRAPSSSAGGEEAGRC